MSSPRYWPSMTDYQEALQSPSLAFSSAELRAAKVEENKLGLPRPICGTFASVYELADHRRRWAVKCFLRNTPDLHERYAKISKHLRKARRLRYFVAFEYQEKALRVHGELFPLVKMEWIDAPQLNTFIEENLSQPRVLEQLGRRWDRLLTDLRAARIAHGDLQHGNVLVLPRGDIRLIDYDGMWVPALEGQGSNETGHPDFQNPQRTQRDFNLETDDFSAAVIQVAITALRHDPGLWQQYNNGDNLLFRRSDFLDTRNSSLLKDLRALDDVEIRAKLNFIIDRCPGGKLARKSGKRRRRVDANGSARNGAMPAAKASSWVSDHVEEHDGQTRRKQFEPDHPGPPSRSTSGLRRVVNWLFGP